jgi:transposase
VEDWVPPESPARFIRQFVAELPSAELGLHRASEATLEGRPCFSYALLWRVWLYGYLCRIRSCRKLEAACRERMDFVWLSGNLRPDHNTLWRFWQTHRARLRQLFAQTVKVACQLDLVGLVLQAVDGTKIQAACAGHTRFDEAGLRKVLARLEEEIAAHEQAIAAAGEGSTTAATLPAELASAQALQAKVAAALQLVQTGETRFCHPQETDARRMECDGGNRFGYNAQAVVDAQERIIVAAEVVTAENDTAQLNFMLQQAEAILGEESKAVPKVVDGGYCAGAQIQEAQAAGRDVYSPVPCDPPGGESAPYHSMHFQHDAARDTVTCPQGQTLTFRRERERSGGVGREYRAPGKVCRACPAFGQCTRDRHGRSLELWPWTSAMQAHREKMATPRAAELYAQRSAIIEPVFGWLKEAWQFRRWTWRGQEKVAAQWQLLCAVTNLRALCRTWLGANAPA